LWRAEQGKGGGSPRPWRGSWAAVGGWPNVARRGSKQLEDSRRPRLAVGWVRVRDRWSVDMRDFARNAFLERDRYRGGSRVVIFSACGSCELPIADVIHRFLGLFLPCDVSVSHIFLFTGR
jgi:hypothetical protein